MFPCDPCVQTDLYREAQALSASGLTWAVQGHNYKEFLKEFPDVSM
jgi:hypothetical protein